MALAGAKKAKHKVEGSNPGRVRFFPSQILGLVNVALMTVWLIWYFYSWWRRIVTKFDDNRRQGVCHTVAKQKVEGSNLCKLKIFTPSRVLQVLFVGSMNFWHNLKVILVFCCYQVPPSEAGDAKWRQMTPSDAKCRLVKPVTRSDATYLELGLFARPDQDRGSILSRVLGAARPEQPGPDNAEVVHDRIRTFRRSHPGVGPSSGGACD